MHHMAVSVGQKKVLGTGAGSSVSGGRMLHY